MVDLIFPKLILGSKKVVAKKRTKKRKKRMRVKRKMVLLRIDGCKRRRTL